MDRSEQGALLKAWRRYAGDVRGRPWTQEALAAEIAERAEIAGYPKNSRKVPGSHAAVNRWEKGKVDQSIIGLQLIAEIYGVGVVDLMKSPPDIPAAPPHAAPSKEDDLVDAFRDFMKTRIKG